MTTLQLVPVITHHFEPFDSHYMTCRACGLFVDSTTAKVLSSAQCDESEVGAE